MIFNLWSLGGTVEIVGSDSVEEENGDSYYIAQIEPISDITTTGKILEIIPGMTAQIDIITGKERYYPISHHQLLKL